MRGHEDLKFSFNMSGAVSMLSVEEYTLKRWTKFDPKETVRNPSIAYISSIARCPHQNSSIRSPISLARFLFHIRNNRNIWPQSKLPPYEILDENGNFRLVSQHGERAFSGALASSWVSNFGDSAPGWCGKRPLILACERQAD